MKKGNIVYMDGFDQVIDEATQNVVFKTNVVFSDTNCDVIDNVVNIWNSTKSVDEVDGYLLDEEKCTQEEREHIVESLFEYFNELYVKAMEMEIEDFKIFANHLETLADEYVPRHLKNESLFLFLQTKCLGKTFQEWNSILNDNAPIDFQLIHNGKDQIKLFELVYKKFKLLFDAVVKHIFDNWICEVSTSNGMRTIPVFCSEFAKNNMMVNRFALLVDGFNLNVTYRQYSPMSKDDKFMSLGIHFVVE
jgi:hypothetical protein